MAAIERSVNYSTLTTSDIADIALQRTQHLWSIPLLGSPSYWFWLKFGSSLLNIEARIRGEKILNATMVELRDEFEEICLAFGNSTNIESVIDIGCGHAFINLLFWRKYGCNVHLIDIETSTTNHHGYSNAGAGYASLNSALKFLTANGVDGSSVTCTNPDKANLELEPSSVYLAISLLSAGFHYPVSTYADTVYEALQPGGAFVFDARNDTQQEKALEKFSSVSIIHTGEKHKRLMAIR